MEFSPSDSEQDPLLLSNLKAKGGYGTLPFIVGVDTFEKMASIGLMPNMILYLKSEYGLQNARAVNILFLWSSATNFMPIVGAFLCDSFVGRFRMVSYGSITSLLGMILLLLTTIQPRSPCHQVSESCRSPTTFEFLVLYTSFALMSFGSGGVRSSSIALAVDQLSKREKEEGILERFFNWYCLLSAGTTLIAMTFMVYIQDKLGWTVGFGVPVVLMVISVALFFSASPFYIKRKPKTNLFSGYAQVLVASYKNRLLQLPSQVNYELYHNEKEHMTQIPTEKLRFLNKACVIRNPMHDLTPDGRASDPWSL
ncbi:Protein NRT1/ PTR FAMILY 1.2 [Quillaja saponaria]|uniref:Protein NRT1/ PTR FAMILY 1.2 n=1 Tax=Quillaja saponaria TaxID=32244 RepID=A0AAD7LX64_QUISA|nr:Protein NRT1/ PTR FAMILY 1.2 [Quillaja saponaria]